MNALSSVSTWVVLSPAVAALVVMAVPRRLGDVAFARLGVLAGAVPLGCAVAVAVGFDRDHADRPQAVTDSVWVSSLDVHWHLGVDGVSLPLVLLTALLAVLCLGSLLRHPPECGGLRGLVCCVLLVEAGALGTFMALDLVVFFLFFEVALIPMWFVIAGWGDPHDEPGRRRAATTFLLFTVIGSAVMLLGFLLVHASTGTFDMVELARRGGGGIGGATQTLAAVAILVGLAVKSPLWPLHIWLPDAHEKAPTVGSVLLAGVLLKMGTYGFVRILLPELPDGARTLAPYLAAFATVGIVYGALACLGQSDVKRLIAYSSVGHMGFVLLGIATLTPVGVSGALFANLGHGLITGLLFFVVGGVKERYGTADFVALGRGLYGRTPRLAGILAFAAVASLGLPGLAGFWGEMLSMLGAFRPGGGLDRPTYLVLMALAGVGTVLTAAYFLRMLRRLCQGVPRAESRPVDVDGAEVAAWSPLVVLTLALGLAPGLALAVISPASQAVFGSVAR